MEKLLHKRSKQKKSSTYLILEIRPLSSTHFVVTHVKLKISTDILSYYDLIKYNTVII